MTVNDVVSVLGLNGVAQLFMLSCEDIDRYKDQKAVLAIMAASRDDPEFKKAEQTFSEFKDDADNDLVIVTEDHADGPLHERFDCNPLEYFFALIAKNGDTVMHGNHTPSIQAVINKLAMEPEFRELRLDSSESQA